MRKIITAFAVAGSVLLSGCGTTGGLPTNEQINTTVAQVQSLTQTICAFVPTVSTIANILSGGASVSISEIANGICAAVTAKSLRRGGPRPNYKGVPIRGRFVR